jgi:hypothetical protein
MTALRTTATSAAALGVLFTGSAAMADVTAEQVWQNWRSYFTSTGYAVTATEQRSGDDLIISDFRMLIDIPEENSTAALSIGDMTLTDRGDGTVSISFPPDLPIDLAITSPEEDVDISLNYASRGLSVNVSGEPGAQMLYTYAAAQIAVTLESVTVDGQTMPLEELGRAEMTFSNLTGSSEMADGTSFTAAQRVDYGSSSILLDVTDPETGENVKLDMATGPSQVLVNLDVPKGPDPEDVAAQLRDGMALSFETKGQDTTLNLAVAGGEDDVDFTARFGTTESSLLMDGEGFAVDFNVIDLEQTATAPDLPFPVEMAVEEMGFGLEMPLLAGEAEQPFAFSAMVGGFTTTDMIWAMIDPGAQLPRDPATILVNLTGMARLFVDIVDETAMAAVEEGDDMPGEITSLEITDLEVSAAGAELLGEGAFTFDNSDLETFDGIPAPDGAINLTLTGANALLDTLVNMGLLPQDQASGARMMMGLFAVPGNGPDTLESTIEVKPNGQILANGQRIQ